MAWMLATVEEVKGFQKGSIDNQLDTLIRAILLGVTASFAKECGREWDRKSYSKMFSPSGREKSLWLPETPLAALPGLTPPAIIQVWEHIDGVFDAESVLVVSSNYRYHPTLGQVWRMDAPWMAGFQTVKVTWTGGYLTGHGLGTPDDLRLWAIMQSSFIFQRRGDLGLLSHSVEGASIAVERDIELLPEVKDGLNEYNVRRRLV